MATVYTLAVWHVAERRWAAFATSDRGEVVASLKNQLDSLVMVFSLMVEVPGGSDDEVEAVLARLPRVNPEAVFSAYFDLAEFVSVDAPFAHSCRPDRPVH